MELRRALLLFAIVLGLAAIASSIARQPDEGSEGDQAGDGSTTSATSPAPSERSSTATSPDDETTRAEGPDPGSPSADRPPEPANRPVVRFSERNAPQTKRLELDRAATVLVGVDGPGQVYIPSLGLTEAAAPLTPARFEVFFEEPGRHRIEVDPATPDEPTATIGTLRVVGASS